VLTESSTKPSSDFKRIHIACGGFIITVSFLGCVCGGAFFVVVVVVVVGSCNKRRDDDVMRGII
jgi:hypothetical protein